MSRAESDRPARDRGPAQIEIERLRTRIDAVDDAILAALNERAELVLEVGRAEAGRGQLGLRADPGAADRRSAARAERRSVSLRRSRSGVPRDHLRDALARGAGARRLPRARGHVLAPGGARTVRRARAADCGVGSISDVFAAVEAGRAQLGIVPVENTTEGVVTQTLDALGEREVTVCAERVLRVSIALLSKSGQLADVRRVISHPQPLAQCRRWLDQQLPGIAREEMASTAAAAQRAAGDPECAAIGSLLSAEVYGLAVVARGDRGPPRQQHALPRDRGGSAPALRPTTSPRWCSRSAATRRARCSG